MREDVDHRVADLVVDLMRLRQLLPPDDFADLLGAVSVEVETGMELLVERAHRPRQDANVIAFPGAIIVDPLS